ncbi:MAG: GlxA family transcriptional regulator [Pseudomonadota bacterium]
MSTTGSTAPTELQILVTPDFNLAATMGFVDPFRVANYLDGAVLFRWEFLSATGGPIRASNGASLDTRPLPRQPHAAPDFLVVSSSWEPEAHASAPVKAALRRADLQGATLCALDTGAFILAYAGLLGGHKATVHYEHIDSFQELFPETEVSEALWVFDGPRITCCGGVAATELALHIVRGIHGPALANAAARYIFAPGLRDHNTPQNPQDSEPLGATVPGTVRKAIKLMEENLESPLAIAEICRRLDGSHRQLNRLFARYVRKTPALYYRDIRLDRARGLVTQTALSMAEIAEASGFSGQVHFSRAYKERFGLPPSRDRVEGRIPFEFRAWPMHRKARRALE